MTAPQPGLAGLLTRLGPTGIAALSAGVLILFGLGFMIVPALTAGDGASAAGPSAPPETVQAAPAAAPSSPAAASPEVTTPAPSTAKTMPVAANFNTGYEDRVVQLINGERRKARCEPFKVDARLRTTARSHAADMAAKDLSGSRGSDGSDPAGRAQAAGYGAFEDELTAKGGDPGDVVKHWLRDDDSEDMLLDCDLRSIGVGAAMRGRTPYWTLDTGRA